ncbi:MAG: MerR family DNA-binding transcriptional regulator [Phycisphaeraceae bacterium]|nr:MerR family DNA-binding transcriptional regulator [Phycisphaeraceae bacterium]
MTRSGAAQQPTKLDGYLTVAEAATFLGVSPSTLRNWDRLGKLSAHRHPVNGYRLYDPSDLRNLLDRAQRKGAGQ